MPIVTINRMPSWGAMPVGAVISLPDALANPLIAAGEAVPTPNATPTQTNPYGVGVDNVDGAEYLVMSDGTLLPLAGFVGTGEQPRIAGVQTMQITCNAGSDIAHPKLLFLPNCTNGIDPDTEDNVLASEAFNELSPGVYDLNLPGGAAGTIVPISPPGGITMIHFAFAGSGTYTQAAGATVTGLEMVLAKWPSDLGISTVLLYIGESTIGAGANYRYRNIVAIGFTA